MRLNALSGNDNYKKNQSVQKIFFLDRELGSVLAKFFQLEMIVNYRR